MEPQQSNIINKVIGGIITLGVIAGVTTLAMKDKSKDTATATSTTEVAGTEEHTDGSDMEKESVNTSAAQTIHKPDTRRDDDNDQNEENDDDDDDTGRTSASLETTRTGVQTTVSTGVKAGSVTYKDGTYSATGSYHSPAGTEQVSVSVVLKNNIVTDSTFSATSDSSRSRQYQSEFAAGYKTQVIGKDISTISVGKVSGSSLTGNGFNDALTKIKAAAKI